MADNDLSEIDLTRGKVLAAKMFKSIRRDEDMIDVCVAIAALTVGMLHQQADDAERAQPFLDFIRHLEDDFMRQPWPTFEAKGMH